MPIDIRIIRAPEFLKVTGKGDSNLEESKRLHPSLIPRIY